MVKTLTKGTENGRRKQSKGTKKDAQQELAAVPSNSVCKTCNKEIEEGGSFVGCDSCMTWLHLECSQVPQVEFDFLHKHKTTKLLYHCNQCRKESDQRGNKDAHIEAQNAKIEKLSEMVQSISEQNQQILDLLKKEKNSVVEVKIEETVQESIHTNIKELLDDHVQKDVKKNNLIIFNLPEAEEKGDGLSAESQDLAKVTEILNFIDTEIITPEAELNVNSISRVGDTKSRDSTRPRPVKIEFPNQRPRNKALRNARNMKNFTKYPKIGISNDKSEKEMKEDRTLRWKLAQHRKDGQDWTIFDNQPVLRKDIPRLRAEKEEAKKGGNSKNANTRGTRGEGDLNKEGDLNNIQTINGGNLNKQQNGGDLNSIQQNKEGDLKKIQQKNGGDLNNIQQNNGGDLNHIQQQNGGDLNNIQQQKEGDLKKQSKEGDLKVSHQEAKGESLGATASAGNGGDSDPEED